ncbi:ABC transporter ATP-binding protein [Eggerthella timonensis]|uniref:ABC transporter ATP-binding protein n=1 Tax=Eggerthella timonensis TaxID=1871008 RepID=UPI000C77E9AB|nr:ATP-binding cassette domain-containing protein [Eggerthella timonensis]
MDTRTPPFFELHNAVVQRAGAPILSIESFELAEGEHLALLGPNGSGKSTFVKLITREVLPLHRDEPPVRFRGRDRATLAEVKQSLGVVSSSMQDQIAVHLPSVDVVAGGLFGTLGVPVRADDAAVDDARVRALGAMELLGVDDLASRDIMTLSTGQARRVLIARALVHDPDALVFDEPCTGLDPEGMYYVRSSMRTLAQAGKSIVLVTHYPEDIIPEIKRVVLLKDGLVHADATKESLMNDQVMSDLFDVPLRVQRMSAPAPVRCGEGKFDDAREEEYFSLVSAY